MEEKNIITGENINSHLKDIEEHSKIAVSVDCVIFGYDMEELKVLTISCNMDPYKGLPSLIGDLVNEYEDLDQAAKRILKERTGIDNLYLEQIKSFGKVDRHPLGRVITVTYFALVKKEDYTSNGTRPAVNSKWIALSQINEMAFDHLNITNVALDTLRKKLLECPIWMKLLPVDFSLPELQHLFETIIGIPLDKRNFRKKILSLDIIQESGKKQKDVPHRPANLYRVNQKKLKKEYSFLLKNPFHHG
ncbi:MAG: NUDIX domain-containing protein [Saprospirales bacterium]|nr:MAG: NUDIX domain-containing protein [Saprospirales bacterium]